MANKRELDRESMFRKIMPSAAAAATAGTGPDEPASAPAVATAVMDAPATAIFEEAPPTAEAAFASEPETAFEPTPAPEMVAPQPAVVEPPVVPAPEMVAPQPTDAEPSMAAAPEMAAPQPVVAEPPMAPAPEMAAPQPVVAEPPMAPAPEMAAPQPAVAEPPMAPAPEMVTPQPVVAEPPMAPAPEMIAPQVETMVEPVAEAGEQGEYYPVNLAEVLIEEIYPRYLHRLRGCSCSRCKDDACAIALNRIKPRYIASDAYTPAALKDRELIRETVTALIKALFLVKRKPRHDEAEAIGL